VAEPRTWILTGSPENHAATAQHGYRLIGCKERRRRQAEQLEHDARVLLDALGARTGAGAGLS